MTCPNPDKQISSEQRIAIWREDIRRARAYGVDIPLVVALLDRPPLESIRINDEALEFFASIGAHGAVVCSFNPSAVSLISIVEGFAEADLRVILVGGLAARIHGAAQLTEDTDFCYDTTAANEEDLVSLLSSWNAYPLDLAPGHPFRLTREQFTSTIPSAVQRDFVPIADSSI